MLGTGATIALSIAGVDAPMDVRDITAEIEMYVENGIITTAYPVD